MIFGFKLKQNNALIEQKFQQYWKLYIDFFISLICNPVLNFKNI